MRIRDNYLKGMAGGTERGERERNKRRRKRESKLEKLCIPSIIG